MEQSSSGVHLERAVLVQGDQHERTFYPGDFPLTISGASNADIRLPDVTSDTELGFIDLWGDVPFLQPVRGATSVLLNNTVLKQSEWLGDGDTIRIGNALIRCEVSVGELRLRLQRAPVAPDTLPPRVARRPDAAIPIEPVAFSTTPAAATRGGRSKKTQRALLAALFGALVFAAWFLFTATPVAVHIAPLPDRVKLSGGWFTPKIGDRYLLRPGRYVLVAEKTGYHPLAEPVEISGGPDRQISFTLEKLPGLLSITTRPPTDARVTIDGRATGVAPLTDAELSPGRHEVVVQAERYQDTRTNVEIEGALVKQTLDIELTPAWAPVSFSSTPSGAALFVDGNEIGRTPLTTDLLAGNYILDARYESYDTWSTELVVVANQPQAVPEIVLQKTGGTLTLRSEPAGATVTVADQFRGQTPLVLNLSADDVHSITLSKAGYGTVTRTIRVESAKTSSVSVELTPTYGLITVVSEPADAELYIDGTAKGVANQQLTLTAVPHQLEIRKPGFQSYQTTVTPRQGFAQEVNVTLQTLQAARIASTPRTISTSEGQELHYVLPGSFTMGASRREQGRRANESLRAVELTQPFYIGTKEVTNAEFRRFQPRHSSGVVQGLAKSFSLDGDDRPVVGVTWEQAARYSNWLSAKESLPPAYIINDGKLVTAQPVPTGYRLPTEAEWAWVTRFADGSNSSKYAWGSSFPPSEKVGNFADRSAGAVVANTLTTYNDGFLVTAPVGSFTPNPLGIYDLAGNVAEWCHDYYTIYPSTSGKPHMDPLGPQDGKYHVIRGSSWQHASISALRLTYRDYGRKARPDVGFRIARYASTP